MSAPAQSTSPILPESLSGLIERVTFANEDSGFSVLKVKAKGHRDLVTVVGTLPSVSAGEWLTAQGHWVQDREFGLQFRAEVLASTAPTTKEGIEKYLGSGMVKGIGPIYAKKLVDNFGEKIFDIIEKESARLEDVDGIGPKRRKKIKEAWAEQKVIRNIMVFLHSNGVSTSRATRIFKTYGEDAIEKVRSDPYRLVGRAIKGRWRALVIRAGITPGTDCAHPARVLPNLPPPVPMKASRDVVAVICSHGPDGVAGPRHTLPPKAVIWIKASLAGSNSTRWIFENGNSSKARQVFQLSRESRRPAPGASSARVM